MFKGMTVDLNKRAAFVRLASNRTEKALKAISTLAHLANRRSYSYTEKDVSKIILALRREVSDLEALFKKSDKKSINFKLDD